ncbi:cytidine deaminase-like protein [Thamnocephalis sphaerospora]|uniref:Cytidine deaminase-like protein n=1 Tax=Thamnocephalis sphaerospora TaxID=78915 RepID=A0A4P9XFQ6_9FUNG|nr:cytidine deaminase-like protein [Thamnocephalis sphaerospora]|eukprot:RKP04433.1 cytidine deaminase-like protein [Thamnocephalis sphaerospora]
MELLLEQIATADLSQVIQPRVVKVSRYAPLTRAQFDAWRPLWPMNFREHRERFAGFNEEELACATTHMRRAIQLAVDAKEQGESSMAAILVDPTENRLVACAHDTRNADGHPLHHAVMNCISAAAACQRPSKEASEIPPTVDERPVDVPQKRDIDTALADDSPDKAVPMGAYLCNGLDLYATHEPCAMCSMALLHSRIGRVFYALPSTTTGALGSCYRVHAQPGLNHKFLVYRGLLADEAVQAGLE